MKRIVKLFCSSATNGKRSLRKFPSARKGLFQPSPNLEPCVAAVPYASHCDLEFAVRGAYSANYIDKTARDALHVVPHGPQTDPTNPKVKECFVFRDGIVVFWNMAEIERFDLLENLHGTRLFPTKLMKSETEYIPYLNSNSPTSVIRHDVIRLSSIHSEHTNSSDAILERYAFSHGVAMSVKLGICEATFDRIVEPEDSKLGLSHITNEMQSKGVISIGKKEAIRKIGLLYRLRHELSLATEVSDFSELFWERSDLERIRALTVKYMDIEMRTKSLNLSLDYTVDFFKNIDEMLRDEHGSRLEKIIIAAILVEIVIALIHMAMERT